MRSLQGKGYITKAMADSLIGRYEEAMNNGYITADVQASFSKRYHVVEILKILCCFLDFRLKIAYAKKAQR